MAVFGSTLLSRRLVSCASAVVVCFLLLIPAVSATAASVESLATYLRTQQLPALTKCTLRLAKRLAVANQRGDASGALTAKAEYDSCRSAALSDWIVFRNDLLSEGGLPVCLPTSIEIDGVRSTLIQDLAQTMSAVFCDGAAGSGGVHIPSTVSVYRHEAKLAKAVSRFVNRHGRCRISYQTRVAAAAGEPEALALAQTTYDRCYYRAALPAYESVPSLLASGPTCLQSSAAQNLLGSDLGGWAVLDVVNCAP
jgi:hypothetical protein